MYNYVFLTNTKDMYDIEIFAELIELFYWVTMSSFNFEVAISKINSRFYSELYPYLRMDFRIVDRR